MDPVLVLFGVAVLASSRRRTRVEDTTAAPAPKTYAYLYQLPDDGFTTTRMAFQTAGSGKPPEFMGLFGSPQAARKIAAQKGWELAWPEVRSLSKDPQ